MKKRSPLAIVCAMVMAVSSVFAQNAPVTWSTGTFADNTILSLLVPGGLVYAVDFAGTELTTDNGYLFGADDKTNISYTGGINVGSGTFIGNPPNVGSSVDANFNTILGSAELNPSAPGYTFMNLQVGTFYQVLLLRTDSRSGSEFAGRSFSATGGGNTSATQQYAFDNLGVTLGGYIVGTFVADANTQIITVSGSNDGGMLNAAVLSVPEPSTTAGLIFAFTIGMVLFFRRKRTFSDN